MFRECFRVTRRGSDRLKVSEIAIGESVLSLTAQNTMALCLSTCYVVASRCGTVSVAASDVVQVLFCGLVQCCRIGTIPGRIDLANTASSVGSIGVFQEAPRSYCQACR